MAKINKRILCSLCIMVIVLTSLFASVSTFAADMARTNTGEIISDMWFETPTVSASVVSIIYPKIRQKTPSSAEQGGDECRFTKFRHTIYVT